MLVAVLMLAQAASAELPDRYRALTRAEVPCQATADPDEITVCGAREADGYRITFIAPAESDRDRPHEYTERLLDGRTNVCGISSRTFRDCGFVGVTMKTGFDGKVTRERPLAR